MRRFHLAVTAALVWAFTTMAAFAQGVGSDAARAILNLNAHDVAVEDAERWLTTPEFDDRVFRIAWISAASGLFQAEEVMEITSSILGDTLAEPAAAELLQFFGDDLGQQLTLAEKATQVEGYDNEAAVARGARILAVEPQRREKFDRLHTAFQLNAGADISREVTASARFAVIKSQLAQRGEVSDDAVILALAYQGLEIDEARDREESIMRYAYTYRDVTDEGVLAYADMLESDAGQAFYTAINAGYERVIIRDLMLFRDRLARNLSAQEL
ncbi:MAG: hypothetical protein AAFQ36_12255 [Pseudomonadota bacterium]